MLLFILGVFIYILFFIWIKNKSDNIIIKKNNIKFTWNTLNYKNYNRIKNDNNERKKISLKKALEQKKALSYFFNRIKGKYNLVDVIINKFRKVKNKRDYFKFEKKFWWDVSLYSFIKVKEIKLADKYMNYYLWSDEHKDRDKIENIKNKAKRDYMIFMFNKVLKGYYKKWYFDEMWYINKWWEYDYFRLSLMNYPLDKKIKICKEWFKTEDGFRNCKTVVIYMAANRKNGYCNMLKRRYEKKWCNDTLSYLDKNK